MPPCWLLLPCGLQEALLAESSTQDLVQVMRPRAAISSVCVVLRLLCAAADAGTGQVWLLLHTHTPWRRSHLYFELSALPARRTPHAARRMPLGTATC